MEYMCESGEELEWLQKSDKKSCWEARGRKLEQKISRKNKQRIQQEQQGRERIFSGTSLKRITNLASLEHRMPMEEDCEMKL